MSIWSDTSESGSSGSRPRGRAERRPGLSGSLLLALMAGAIAIVGLASTPATLRATVQAPEEIEAARFEIRVNDRRVGMESFAVRREGGVIRAAGRITLDATAPELVPMDVRMQTNLGFRPNSYALRATAGPVRGVDGVWSGDRLRLHISCEEGERWREFMTPGPLAILERGVAHHYYLLFRQLSPDPAGARVSVIVPLANRQATATVRGGQPETVRVGDEQRSATRWDVEVDGTQHRVWLDGEGRVLRFATPGKNRVYVRLP